LATYTNRGDNIRNISIDKVCIGKNKFTPGGFTLGIDRLSRKTEILVLHGKLTIILDALGKQADGLDGILDRSDTLSDELGRLNWKIESNLAWSEDLCSGRQSRGSSGGWSRQENIVASSTEY
jgi:hypothetical protein